MFDRGKRGREGKSRKEIENTNGVDARRLRVSILQF